ncbi:hypothetical protein M0813_27843 [Anaeramoeba flamelloides]|uniref:Uncharacterized protein n=1 Tax=Anaeramoeba flamelloides TaxID=1746091 RepID=A0AAV8A7R8_9EUKA|nr:hypothetical protein M0812_01300 [Anaeramoeba flamelloides]KAJ6236456.1 hypothetical protein M0813_27843 [Anaeramoeba flamelloides]
MLSPLLSNSPNQNLSPNNHRRNFLRSLSCCSPNSKISRLTQEIQQQSDDISRSQYQIFQLTETNQQMKKNHKKEQDKLSSHLERRLLALEESNQLRNKINLEKRRMKKENNLLKKKLAFVNQRMLELEIENTKLKNQIKQPNILPNFNKIYSNNCKHLNSYYFLGSNKENQDSNIILYSPNNRSLSEHQKIDNKVKKILKAKQKNKKPNKQTFRKKLGIIRRSRKFSKN